MPSYILPIIVGVLVLSIGLQLHYSAKDNEEVSLSKPKRSRDLEILQDYKIPENIMKSLNNGVFVQWMTGIDKDLFILIKRQKNDDLVMELHRQNRLTGQYEEVARRVG